MGSPGQLDLAIRPKPAARARARRAPNLSRRERCTALSIVVTGEQPPSEFRIFTAGEVETTKGTFTFDAAAAAAVMADYEAHGIDLMIDYDHASLSPMAVDPALSGKAAGWFNIELRAGELWAVNVRWTEPAAEALRRKEWRFMSPAFQTDEGRVCSLMNVAITNLPATRKLEPLMAASVTAGENAMTLEEFMKVCKALGLDMSMSLDDALAKIQSGAPAEEPAGEEPSEPAVAAAEEPMPPAADDKKDKPAEVAAAASKLMRLSGKTSFVEAIAEVETWRASHIELETERVKLAEERTTLETAERRKLCVEFVTLGGRAPATVWADETATTPKPYLVAMPIADLRAMHADAIRASGGGKRLAPTPPRGAAGTAPGALDKHGLDARELQICKEAGTDPAVFADLKARREANAKTAKS